MAVYPLGPVACSINRLRAELSAALDLGPVHRCTVRVPEQREITIDGCPYNGTYTGHYFSGQTIRIHVAGDACSWRVQDQVRYRPTA